jgi:hypothetical protein
MQVGGYTLDLYCDRINPTHEHKEFPHTFYGELGTKCRKAARKAGWKLQVDGTTICPKCSGNKSKRCN